MYGQQEMFDLEKLQRLPPGFKNVHLSSACVALRMENPDYLYIIVHRDSLHLFRDPDKFGTTIYSENSPCPWQSPDSLLMIKETDKKKALAMLVLAVLGIGT
jgi:hypothetical protein